MLLEETEKKTCHLRIHWFFNVNYKTIFILKQNAKDDGKTGKKPSLFPKTCKKLSIFLWVFKPHIFKTGRITHTIIKPNKIQIKPNKLLY